RERPAEAVLPRVRAAARAVGPPRRARVALGPGPAGLRRAHLPAAACGREDVEAGRRHAPHGTQRDVRGERVAPAGGEGPHRRARRRRGESPADAALGRDAGALKALGELAEGAGTVEADEREAAAAREREHDGGPPADPLVPAAADPEREDVREPE